MYSLQIPENHIKSLTETKLKKIYKFHVAILLPYMMLINLTDFWNYKYRNVTGDWNISDSSFNDMQKKFPSYISISGMAL